MLQEYDLGQDALVYIRDSLEQGKTLSSLLLGLPLDSGQVVTYLPADVDPTALHEFRWGGVPGLREARQCTIAIIADHLAGGTNRYAVFEHALARPFDSGIQALTMPYFSFESDVYFFLTPADTDKGQIAKTVQRSVTYLFLGVLTSLTGALGTTPREEVPLRTLEEIVQNMEAFLISAYDGEGILVWRRR